MKRPCRFPRVPKVFRRIKLVPVETGIADSTNTEILGGLEEGTEVFLAGPSDLYADMSDDGMSVS